MPDEPAPPPYTAGPYPPLTERVTLAPDPHEGWARFAGAPVMLLVLDYGGRDDSSARLMGSYVGTPVGQRRAAEHAQAVDGLVVAAPLVHDFRKESR